eukprot:7765836-Karenia_brevis.AAC.1
MKKDRNPCDEATIPGFFIGWVIESGMRYRDMLKIADYHAFKKGNFSRYSIHDVPVKEVVFPEKADFPFYAKKTRAMKEMREFRIPDNPGHDPVALDEAPGLPP